MTKQEFIKFTSKQLKSGFSSSKGYDPLQLDANLHQICDRHFNVEKILDFFCDMGFFYCVRSEKTTNDIIHIDIRFININGLKKSSYYEFADEAVCYWNDINSVVVAAVQISNCAGIIEYLFISESGMFYNEKHNLIAENQEQLFDYLAYAEYDFHPVISNRTFDFMTNAGWHQNRCVDTSVVYSAYKDMGIELSPAQLDVIAECSGLYFSFNDAIRNVDFFNCTELANYVSEYQKEIVQYGKVIAENVIRFGQRMAGNIYLDSKGILLDDWYYPLGRTTLECVNHLMADVPENCVFQYTGEHF